MADEIPTELAKWMARIETKLDTVLVGHDDHEKRIRALETSATEAKDHGPRITALESGRWPLHTITVLLSAAGLIAAILLAILKH
jgi:hypothetical protein